MLTLLGVQPELPLIQYNQPAGLSYNATTDAFVVDTTPFLMINTMGGFGIFTGNAGMDIRIQVNDAGQLIGGTAGDDLIITGDITIDLGAGPTPYSGTLLTGEVTAFGFQENGGTDNYDFRFTPTGGQFAFLFAGTDIGVTTASEISTFNNDFTVNFGGGTKGNVGPIDQLQGEIELRKFVKIVDQPAFAIDIEKYVVPPAHGAPGGSADLCEALGKPVELTFEYTGGNAADANTTQPAGKFSVTGDTNGDTEVFIIASKEGDVANALSNTGRQYFNGTVALDAQFTIDVDNATSEDKFGSNTYLYIFDTAGGTLLQTIQYHTSCSAPIVLGESLGGVVLTGAVGDSGAEFELPAQSSNDFGDDADEPTGPTFMLGDDIVFNYVLTNTVPDTQLSIRELIDDATTPNDESDDFTPLEVVDGFGFNVGDLDMDGRVDFGEQWLFTSTMEADRLGEFRNKIKVIGMPVNDADMRVGTDVMDMDPAHFNVPDPMAGADLCEALGKPVELTFKYTGGNAADANTTQPAGKFSVTGDANGDAEVFIIASKEGDVANALSNTGRQYFNGTVALDALFTIDVDNATSEDKFGSNTYLYIFDTAGGTLLQKIQYHTSCSAPIVLGESLGGVVLTGAVGDAGDEFELFGGEPAVLPDDSGNGGQQGSGGGMMTPMPFNPADLGESDPPGPTAGIGDDLMFSYVVTTPTPGAEFNIDSLFDDNATDDLPPGFGGDDFEPIPVLVDGFNYGDTDQDGLLDFGETWYYSAVTTTVSEGTFWNTAKVTGTEVSSGQMAMDDDTAHYNVEATPAVSLEKYVKTIQPAQSGDDLCEVHGDAVSLVFRYEGSGTTVSTLQDGTKAAVLFGDPLGATTVLIRVTDKTSAADLSGKLFFEGLVDINDTFDASTSFDGDNFGSNTVIHIFTADGTTLLQSVQYHTSCSQPITLGDQIGAVELVGYFGENGTGVEPVDPDPFAELGDPADTAPGVTVTLGGNVTYNYVVTNTGDIDLVFASLFDDNATDDDPPGLGGDDFAPNPVLDGGGFNVGDLDQDAVLDVGESWLFTATKTIDVVGLTTNVAKVTAVGASDPSVMVMDSDPANVTAADPFAGLDLCDAIGHPDELSFTYTGSGVGTNTQQDPSKAAVLFGDPAGAPSVFIRVSDKTNANDTSGRLFFEGVVGIGEAFAASTSFNGDDFRSNTVVHIFTPDGATLLQSVQYHTSCSQPIILGDVIGSIVLSGYKGEDGVTAGTSNTPSPSVVQSGNVVIDSITLDDKKAYVNLTNSTSSSVTIQSLLASFSTTDGATKHLHRIKINGSEIYHEHDDANPITIDSFKGSASLRTMGAGETITIEFEFESGTHLADFDLTVDFGSIVLSGHTGEDGVTASTSSPPSPSVAQSENVVSHSITLDDKRAFVNLTNNTSSSVTIQSLLASFSTTDGKIKHLHRIKINGSEIYHDHEEANPITIDSFEGLASLRTIGAGETITIEFEFERGTHLADFDLSVDFGNGLIDLF